MERRDHERFPRRLKIQFQERGAPKSHLGYTVNISSTGVYVVAGHLLAKGTRVRMQVSSNGDSVMLEGEVVRAERSLHSMKPSGMAVRFLTVPELVAELLPDTEAPADESGEYAPQVVYRLEFPEPKRFVEAFERDLSTGGLFIPMTADPPDLNEEIFVELVVAGIRHPPVMLEARVVHRLDPTMPDGTRGNLLAGVGVELISRDASMAKLRPLLEACR